MAQRNVTENEVRYVVRNGSKSFAAKATFFVLRRSGIPGTDRDRFDAHRLTGIVVIVVNGWVKTVYRNEKPLRHIGKKPKWYVPRRGTIAA